LWFMRNIPRYVLFCQRRLPLFIPRNCLLCIQTLVPKNVRMQLRGSMEQFSSLGLEGSCQTGSLMMAGHLTMTTGVHQLKTDTRDSTGISCCGTPFLGELLRFHRWVSG